MPAPNANQPQEATPSLSPELIHNTLLTEIAWEVCNQVGGIYTVIRSKVPTVTELWGGHYCAIGPKVHPNVSAEFEPQVRPEDPFYQAVERLREEGIDADFGVWLVTGRPKVVLINPYSLYERLGEVKYALWEHHHISMGNDELLDQVCAFSFGVTRFMHHLAAAQASTRQILAHFHEWMAGPAIPELRRQQVPVTLLFTTHATLLGRYLAMNANDFYAHLPFMNWEDEARHFNIEAQVRIERAAAHGSHLFTTVSEVTARECEHLLGRTPDLILPNGINLERFEALHQVQNLHQEFKVKIQDFAMAHFFHSYDFDLDKTLFFFTSGRYEYKNKGFDLTLEALARLNARLRAEGSDMTVIMFFITKKPYHSINPSVLSSRAVLQELQQTCHEIEKQVGYRLFIEAAKSTDHRLPDLNKFVDDYWRLRLRRTLQSWKGGQLPTVVTHNLVNDGEDEILNFLRSSNLVNNPEDRVKVVYHPDFLSTTNPILPLEYNQFVRGCHMGVFPSYYEPWGYTPLECIASGVPTVTSDLSGFGDYVQNNMPGHEERGIYVVNRKNQPFDQAAEQLTKQLYDFMQLKRRERIGLRNDVEAGSVHFDWKELNSFYDKAYLTALERIQ